MIGLIPAAGKGNRLKPITDFIPKELLLYGHKPFIGHCVDSLKKIGLNKVIVVIGHKKGAILDYLKDGQKFGMELGYSYQTEQKGLGDAILSAEKLMGDESELFVLLGDNLIEPSEELLILKTRYLSKKPFAVILVEEMENPTNYGVVQLSDFDGRQGVITELFEKPNEEERKRFEINKKYYVICGAYVFSNRIFNYLRNTKIGKNSELQLTDAIQNALNKGEEIIALKLNGRRVDIGTPYDYLSGLYDFFKNKTSNDIEEISKQW